MSKLYTTIKVFLLVLLVSLMIYVGAYIWLLYKAIAVWCDIYTGDRTPQQIEACEPYKR